ncbi:MAG TPA: hydroxyacid dehydrogenase [Chthoniobacteraceae bacterium]|nr:hydroxyacid dehydrogenase [Chthoniobacteraceae bacterium]
MLFHLPPLTLQRCFHPDDLSRLAGIYRLELPRPGEAAAAMGERFERHAAEAEVVVTGWSTPPLTEAMLAAAPRLRAICHSAGTVKRLLPQSAWERPIIITSANEALAIGVAETTLGMILAGLKNLFQAREWTRNGGWSALSFEPGKPSVQETYQKTVGIVSASAVGRHLIRLLENFQVRVLVYDPFLGEAEATALGVEAVSLPELAQRSDILTIHAPSLPETRGLIDGPLLSLLRDDAIVINTARGDLIDEPALLRELESGRLRAFLDVTADEPPEKEHPFRFLPNVVLTPHLAGAVTNGCFRQGALVVDQLLDLAADRPVRGAISRERFAVMA